MIIATFLSKYLNKLSNDAIASLCVIFYNKDKVTVLRFFYRSDALPLHHRYRYISKNETVDHSDLG